MVMNILEQWITYISDYLSLTAPVTLYLKWKNVWPFSSEFNFCVAWKIENLKKTGLKRIQMRLSWINNFCLILVSDWIKDKFRKHAFFTNARNFFKNEFSGLSQPPTFKTLTVIYSPRIQISYLKNYSYFIKSFCTDELHLVQLVKEMPSSIWVTINRAYLFVINCLFQYSVA